MDIRSHAFCGAAIVSLLFLLLGGAGAALNVPDNMTNETLATLELFLSHYQNMRAMNFTWLAGQSLDMAGGNVGGGDVQALKQALEKDGFTVQLGGLKTLNVYDLVDAGILFSCNGNNPGAPYKAYVLPPASGQNLPNFFADTTNMSIANRLGPDEALVFIGKTPPECTYYSYQTFQYYHYYPVAAKFRKTFANVGDTLNFMTIRTNGSGPENSFDKAAIIISTSDRGINQRVRAAAESAGYPQQIMNTEVLPSAMLRLGTDKQGDALIFLHRMYSFKDPQAGSAYMDNLSGIVLRITPNESTKLDPYPVPKLRVRGTGNTSELDLMPALNDLRQAILQKYGLANATELSTHLWLTEGYDAMQRGLNVIGVTRDTVYLNSTLFTLGEAPGEFLIVYGVNHAASGKAIYSNLGVYGLRLENGVVAVNNSRLTGTAEEYLPDNPAAKYLYVWKLARHCDNDSYCTEVPYGQKSRGIELNETAFMGFRGYIEKETAVGPDNREMAYDRVILFRPQN
jgi:hypothetical protein